MMMKYYRFIIALLIAGTSYGQQPVEISVKNTTMAATDSLMPFWLAANRDGEILSATSWLNFTGLFVGQSYAFPEKSGSGAGLGFDYTWGVHALAGLGETNYYQLNRAFGGLTWNDWELMGGLFYEPEQLAGLSTTNGNLAGSRNARPHPRLRIGTRGYKPLPFIKNRVRFRAEYEEGLLNDNRFVDRARLHRKSFYLQVHLSPSWDLEGGLEHFVMWGGVSPMEAIGRLPSGFKAYLHYITGSSGDESFPHTDRLNVAGNQLGTYQFRATKRFSAMEAVFYLSHPFEDLSGMNWRNWPDNLIGVHVSFNNKQLFVTDVLYEYTGTRQQSIRGEWDRQEPDSYFNNGVYRSGFTYNGRIMGSPLFFPVVVQEGISLGIGSNMVVAHHLGMKGALWGHLHWKGLLTRVSHEGRYFARYESTRHQLSGYLEVQYARPGLPLELGLATAADAGNDSGRNLGVQLIVSRRF